jgi:hypothetical protein
MSTPKVLFIVGQSIQLVVSHIRRVSSNIQWIENKKNSYCAKELVTGPSSSLNCTKFSRIIVKDLL